MVALLVALKGNKKFILFFMAFYPVLPDYFAIELAGRASITQGQQNFVTDSDAVCVFS